MKNKPRPPHIGYKEPIHRTVESVREAEIKRKSKNGKGIKELTRACNIEKLAENAYDEILNVIFKESHYILRRSIIYLEYFKRKTLKTKFLSLALDKYDCVTLYHNSEQEEEEE